MTKELKFSYLIDFCSYLKGVIVVNHLASIEHLYIDYRSHVLDISMLVKAVLEHDAVVYELR